MTDDDDLDKLVQECRAAWQVTQDPARLVEALAYLHATERPLPRWLVKALFVVLSHCRGKGAATAALRSSINQKRYTTVANALDDGLSYSKAFKRASNELKGTPARGKADTMKKYYFRVKRDLEAGNSGRYIDLPAIDFADVLFNSDD